MQKEIKFNNREWIKRTISEFKASPVRKKMFEAEKYYNHEHAILKRKREVIGGNKELIEVKHLPNNKIVDNQFRKMVKQKNNYLLGKPVSFQTDDTDHAKALQYVFGRQFMRVLKNVGRNGLTAGIGYIHPYYNERGEFSFKRFDPTEFVPVWADRDHTELKAGIRFFDDTVVTDGREKKIERIEVYTTQGVFYWVDVDGEIKPSDVPHLPHFIATDGELTGAFNWSRVPIIPFKCNAGEESLLSTSVKSLQDGINSILSNFQNTMEEDTRNTLMVLVNFDGANLGEFRQNLAEYGAVKVRNSQQHPSGDVKTLTVEVNAENYKAIIQVFKKALIENAMGYDAKDDRMSGNANQLNIMSMYNDIDMDTNETELEYQASFEMLLWFVHHHLVNSGKGNWVDEDVTVIFNRDMLMNETEIIDGITKSVGVLSDETLVAQHPYVNDPVKEMERIENEENERLKSAENLNFGGVIGGASDG